MKKKDSTSMKAMKSFELDWNFADPYAIEKMLDAVERWLNIHRTRKPGKDVRIRDIMLEIAPEVYLGFTRGDKCRVGKAFSVYYNLGLFPEFQRGKPKGVTNTYRV